MRKMHHAESCKVAERYSKAAAVLPTVDTTTRPLGMGGGEEGAVGGVLRKRLKYGSSDHLPDVRAVLWPYVASVRPPRLLHLAVFFPECPLCT